MHYATNWVINFVGVFESLIGIFTLGIITPNWRLKATIWKLRTMQWFGARGKNDAQNKN